MVVVLCLCCVTNYVRLAAASFRPSFVDVVKRLRGLCTEHELPYTETGLCRTEL